MAANQEQQNSTKTEQSEEQFNFLSKLPDVLPHQFKYELGWEAEDIITGFRGNILYRVQHITGCDNYGLQPRMDDKGVVPETRQFDENRLKIIGQGIQLPSSYEKGDIPTPPGGPQPNVRTDINNI